MNRDLPGEDEFVALSRFRVANGMGSEVRDAFRARPHKVDDASGFRGMEVLNPIDDSEEFWLITRWSDEESFRAWHHSHLYRESHEGIPRGLKLDASATMMKCFRKVSS